MDEPLTISSLVAIIAAIVGLITPVIGGVFWIIKLVSESRRESSDGRKRLHERLDTMGKAISDTTANQGILETHITHMSGRIDRLDNRVFGPDPPN